MDEPKRILVTGQLSFILALPEDVNQVMGIFDGDRGLMFYSKILPGLLEHVAPLIGKKVSMYGLVVEDAEGASWIDDLRGLTGEGELDAGLKSGFMMVYK